MATRGDLLFCVCGLALCVAVASGCGPWVDTDGGEGDDGAGPGGGGNNEFIDAAPFEGDPVSCEHAEQTHTYVGCDFYPTVHPNVVKAYFDYAVVVANAGDETAHIIIERDGAQLAAGEVLPDGLKTFYLPWVAELKHFTALCDTDPVGQPGPLDSSKRVRAGAYHLTSSEPVTVYQFNPLEYKGGGGPPQKLAGLFDKGMKMLRDENKIGPIMARYGLTDWK